MGLPDITLARMSRHLFAGLSLWLAAFLVAASVGGPASAAPLNLRESIKLAIDRSPRLAKAAAGVGIRELELANARARLLPSLDLSATQGVERRLPPPPPTPTDPVTSQLSLALTQPLYDNGESWTQRELATKALELARLEAQKARDELVLEVARAFYQLSGADLQLRLREEQHRLLERQYKILGAQYRQGLKARHEHLRFKAEVQRALVEMMASRQARREAEINLLKAIGLSTAEPGLTFRTLDAKGALRAEIDFPEVQPSLDSSWLLRLARLEAAMEQSRVELARQKHRPQFTIGAGATYEAGSYLNAPEPIYERDSFTWNLTFGVRYNLWDGGTRAREVLLAQEQSRLRELETADQQVALVAEREANWTSLKTYEKTFRLNKQLIALEAESFDHLETEYRQGRLSYLDLIKATTDLLSARVGFYATYINILEGLAQFHFHEGTIYERLAGP